MRDMTCQGKTRSSYRHNPPLAYPSYRGTTRSLNIYKFVKPSVKFNGSRGLQELYVFLRHCGCVTFSSDVFILRLFYISSNCVFFKRCSPSHSIMDGSSNVCWRKSRSSRTNHSNSVQQPRNRLIQECSSLSLRW